MKKSVKEIFEKEINFDDLQKTIDILQKALNSSRVSVQDLSCNLQKFADTAQLVLQEEQK